ncbi:CDP-diacylglycerol-serine O-phosphatidyltransferase [Orbilia brochopaga]|uniref:CDP-diacylglycerol--serine O-phosphatidyltransferase n=2 Tax=Orbilia brochopaga TaxID=3140254 RepID=A0AAV9VCN7_9PEZI
MSRQRTTSSPSTADVTGNGGADAKMKDFASDTRHFSMIRQLQAADFVTELNGFCGIMSVFSSLRYCLGEPTDLKNVWLALAFMPFGLFFDFMDGRIARWQKKSSLLGQELDSLADLISFGVAPASLAFAIGMRSFLDTLLLSFFVLCGLSRLARFNVSVQHLPKDASGKSKYFEGTPTPTSLGLMMVAAWWVHNEWVLENLPLGVILKDSPLEFHPSVLLFVAHGCAMVSKSLKVPKP